MFALLGHISLIVLILFAVGLAFCLALAIIFIAIGLTLPHPPPREERIAERAIERAALSPEEFEAAKRRVRGPALAMLLVALLNCVPLIVVFFSDGDAVLFSEPTWFIMLTALPVVVTSCLVIFGAICMRDLRWYGLAVAASILVLAPCHYGFVLGIPVGIWALVVLTRANTWQAFQARSGRFALAAGGKPDSLPAAQPRLTSIPLVALCALTPLMFIAALIAFKLWIATYSAEFLPPKEATRHDLATSKSDVSRPAIPPEAVTWGATGPQVGPLLRLNHMFSQEQLDKLDQALAKTYQEYLAAERDHTTRKTNELGRSVITIKAFPKEMGEIENRFWTEADAIVPDNSERGTLRYALKFAGDIFRYGQSESTIEMWRSGTWYYVKSNNDSDYSWPELPRIYQGLWQPPEPEKQH
ncbi:MAG: hypothetical protein IAF94_01130 [Pirellulaceae bacterium]|nr:hypothetical protein [Pirellulaceae bacterium]